MRSSAAILISVGRKTAGWSCLKIRQMSYILLCSNISLNLVSYLNISPKNFLQHILFHQNKTEINSQTRETVSVIVAIGYLLASSVAGFQILINLFTHCAFALVFQ